MVQVTRRDQKEANENIIRRFNRRVLQSGVLARAKSVMRFAKPISKIERRKKAIIGALAGDDARVVEGGDEGAALSLGDALGLGLGGVEIVPEEQDPLTIIRCW